jgi:hypothetical protein
MQKRLHEPHCDRQSWTLARRSMTALSNVRRSSSILEFPAWNRCTFDFSHISTWAARRSTRRVKYCARSKVHSESSPYCLWVIWSQDSRRVPRKDSRSATGASGPASKNRASVSSASISRSVSKFCGHQMVHDSHDFWHTFSGSRSGKTSEHPVSRALGKIARREFARWAAIVSKAEIQGENKQQNVERT